MPSRGRIRKGDKWVQVGSYTVDVVTKTVGRIFKSSGVFPEQRDALATVKDIKLMLKDLDAQRDATRLTLIKDGKVRLLDALADYKSGRLHFIEANMNEGFAPMYEDWVQHGGLAAATKRNRMRVVLRLKSLGLIDDTTPLRDVPDVLRRMRAMYQAEGKAETFNQARTNLLVFLRHHLGYDEESYLFRRVAQVDRIRGQVRRPHHPLRSVHDLLDLLARVNSTRGPNERPESPTDYRPWILFMVFTGIRPTEFTRGLWQRDTATGHLRIKGVKTANASRLVPHVTWLKPEVRSPHGLHQRLEAIDPPTLVRARDFRRTASIWFEEAGIPRSRLSYYLGHGTREMTSLYQRREPTKAELDEDKRRIDDWFGKQRRLPRPKGDHIWTKSADQFVKSMLSA